MLSGSLKKSTQLKDAALITLLEKLHILPVVYVNADKHRTRKVKRFSQNRSDLVWMIDSEAPGAECFRVLDRVNGTKIDSGDAMVLNLNSEVEVGFMGI